MPFERIARKTRLTPDHRFTCRYTNQGDTVLVFGADSNAGVETALSRGRLVEAFVSSPAKVEAVEKAGGTAFRAAFAKGIFQVLVF